MPHSLNPAIKSLTMKFSLIAFTFLVHTQITKSLSSVKNLQIRYTPWDLAV